MRLFSVIVSLFCLLLVQCSGPNAAQTAVTQGIKGIVAEAVGNQMPSPDVKPGGPKPVATKVYVYELTKVGQVVRAEAGGPFYTSINTKEVATVTSDKEGRFALQLAPGSYSLFTKVDGKFYANLFDGANNIQPVTVKANEVTAVNITISAKAFY